MVTKFYFPYQPFWEYFDIVRRSYDLISTTFWYYIHKWIYQFFGFPIFTVKHLNDGLLPVKAQNMFKVFKICILKGIIWFQNSLIPSSRRRRHRSLKCPLCMETILYESYFVTSPWQRMDVIKVKVCHHLLVTFEKNNKISKHICSALRQPWKLFFF